MRLQRDAVAVRLVQRGRQEGNISCSTGSCKVQGLGFWVAMVEGSWLKV